MKTLTNYLLLALLMTAGLCRAQEELPVFPADRPGYTWGVEVLPLHKVSWENGIGYESTQIRHFPEYGAACGNGFPLVQ